MKKSAKSKRKCYGCGRIIHRGGVYYHGHKWHKACLKK